MKYEDRHRALRAAVEAGPRDLTGLYLRDFHERTGRLVDDLVAAVRRYVDWGPDDIASDDWEAMRAALAALDEASGSGEVGRG